MPSDAATLVTTGISFSVLAGIISGVVYVLAHGLPIRRNRKSSTQWHCAICNAHLRSIEGILEERVTSCSTCRRRVCKIRCSHLNPKNRQWICRSCQKDSSWFQGILNVINPKYHNLIAKYRLRMAENERFDEIDEDIEAVRRKEKEHVRDFIERLVATMLGGNVDDSSITKIYNDKLYDALFDRYHRDLTNALIDLGSALHISIANLPVSEQSPCTSHATLKQLIERLLRESLNLPVLERAEDHPAQPSDESGRTYEDLLATAILNKVVSSCQNNLPSSSAASVSSRNSSQLNNDRQYFFGEETLESKWKNADMETTSVSSLEEWLQSDSSTGSTKFVDRLSLTIQQKFEETPASESDEENDDEEYFRTNNLLQNDDTNWYLQKRQFRGGTHSPVPVPMLVPNPVSEAKVLIGDKEVEDTSDLSDAASDFDESEAVPASGPIGFLVESKMVIGGKNPVHTGSDAESSADSGVKEDRDEDYAAYHRDVRPKTDATVDDENVEDSSLLSVYSHTEKDTEYTEKYASLPRTIEKSPSPKAESEIVEEFEGVYSKKDKEKWKHPVEMKNNPYTEESVEIRRRKTNSPFGRDYYLRQASNPSGTKRKIDDEGENWQVAEEISQDDVYEAKVVDLIPEEDSDSSYGHNYYNVREGTAFKAHPSSTSESDGFTLEIEKEIATTIPEEVVPKRYIKLNTEGLLYDPQAEIINQHVAEVKPRIITMAPKTQESSENNRPVALKRNKISDDLNNNNKVSMVVDASPVILRKKVDNSLIKKIYDDLAVRKNREKIPVDDGNVPSPAPSTFTPLETSSPILEPIIKNEAWNLALNSPALFRTSNNSSFEIQQEDYSADFLSVKSLTDDSDTESHYQRQTSSRSCDPEISQLKEKRLVANRLGEFSKSFPNLSKFHTYDNVKDSRNSLEILIEEDNRNRAVSQQDLMEVEEHEPFISVKDLKKKFENQDTLTEKKKPVHSLTARSISKPMREQLKNEDFEPAQEQFSSLASGSY